MNLTTDVSDALDEAAQVADPLFNDYGKNIIFEGVISTIKCFEDNSLVRTAVAEPGDNRVLVIDGGASMRIALLGDLLAAKAVENGWQGVIVNGCIRDSAAIGEMDIGVKAMATHPRKSIKLGVGQRDLTVKFAGVTFTPGAYVYADHDGIVVTEKPL